MTPRAWQARVAVLRKYGSSCSCCGESEPLMLQIDHPNNDGNLERRKRGQRYAYEELARLPVLPNRRVLCANCNTARQLSDDGRCPHEAQRPQGLTSLVHTDVIPQVTAPVPAIPALVQAPPRLTRPAPSLDDELLWPGWVSPLVSWLCAAAAGWLAWHGWLP